MPHQWIVLFDSRGIDSLLALDTLKEEAIINKLSGEPVPYGQLNGKISTLMLRARCNLQRSPEVWAYATEDDISYEAMRKLWEDTPQSMADLIRQRGTLLFNGVEKENRVIV